MKAGLATKGWTDHRLLEKMALKAEELGFDSFLVTDHFMLSSGNSNVDAWTLLPYLAAKTSTIRLGTCVTPIPFRHPPLMAKMLATADVLSGGRMILGSGLGWNRAEFEAFSTWRSLPERAAMTKEALELMTLLWTSGEPVDFSGRFLTVKGAVVEPKPIQKPYPPIWFGAMAPFHLGLAGRFGRGWIPVGPRWASSADVSPDGYRQMKGIIEGELRRREAPPKDFVFSILIGATDVKTLRSDVDRYIAAGMNYFILGQPRGANEGFLGELETIAKDVVSSL
ncbi:MAG TPA: LLM class flavin-dependent oxidoreductase [Conexivisphaerales archaeon]|nr:LLM class flavin-dependent oxidoreductase [Conexivisphaerales archaeon]